MHLRSFLCLLGIAVDLSVKAGQTPLRAGTANGSQSPDPSSWDTPPHPDATGHLILDTAANLLNHWSNAYHRNGHTIVPVTVSPGTLLFHGRNGRVGPEAPTGAEWLTLDVEHALYFSSYEGHLFTYAATRELRLLYFDGASADVIPTGTLDSQDVIIYGNVLEFHWSPFVRIVDLCRWAKPRGVDGFVRMEFDFEIMYCNFTNGLEMVSDMDNLPVLGRSPPGWQGSIRSPFFVAYETLAAGNWHNSAPLPGMHVDYSRFITFYDPKYESLVDLRRRAGSREQYRLHNISAVDVKQFTEELDEVLSRPAGDRGSGVDWASLMRHFVQQYADRLEFLQHLLHSVDERGTGGSNGHHNITGLIYDVRQQVLTMLAPYISRASFSSANNETAMLNATWFEDTIERCTSRHTSHLPVSSFTRQEHVLKSSIDQTAGEICRTICMIWRTVYTAESVTARDTQLTLIAAWMKEIDRLIGWLGWAVWQKCKPACSEDEICSVPQWPFDGIRLGTENPSPRCISRLHWRPLIPPRYRLPDFLTSLDSVELRHWSPVD